VENGDQCVILDLRTGRSYISRVTPGRPLEFDPDEALGAAVEVFWTKGYEATSLSDLLDAMSLSKSSLYQAFGSKQRLFERCLARYADDLSAAMRARLDEATSARRFIEETFRAVARTAEQPAGSRGCLVANSASELGQRDPSLAAPVADGLARFSGVFRRAVERAQAAGEIPAEADPRTLATYLVACMNGLRTMIKAGASRRAAKDVVSLMLRALD
jgi:TetR/AcrR family transcriptional repressor of nem operon